MDFASSWALTLDPVVARGRAVDERGRTAGFVRQGARHVDVVVRRRDDQATVVRIERDIATGTGAAVVGRFLRAVQTELWQPVDEHGTVEARIDVAFPGRPIAVTADLDLHRTATGFAQTVTGRATVRLPGVGRLVERRIVSALLASMDDPWGDAPAE